MLTPSQITERQIKAGIGYDKKEVEQFHQEIASDFETLKKENLLLEDQVRELTESLSYYKSIEKTLQKALVLAEKAAQDTRSTALREADSILLEAKANASLMMAGSRQEMERMEQRTFHLKQQYELFKINFESLLQTQLELMNNRSLSLDIGDFLYQETAAALDTVTQEFISTLSVKDSDQTPAEEEAETLEEEVKTTEDGFEFL
ncbi:MAG: DivIVA domain-containing protein [Mobilitalea sp.]